MVAEKMIGYIASENKDETFVGDSNISDKQELEKEKPSFSM